MLLLPRLLSAAAPPPLTVIVLLIVGFFRAADAGRQFRSARHGWGLVLSLGPARVPHLAIVIPPRHSIISMGVRCPRWGLSHCRRRRRPPVKCRW